MENVNNTDKSNNTSNETKQEINNTATSNNDNNQYLCKIQCCIRRKPNLTGLPGQDPNLRIYKIGGSLDSRTSSSLKGVTGLLEQKYMPSIIGVSHNDPTFKKSIEIYWSSISKVVPPDESHIKEDKRGVPLSIQFYVVGKARKERFDKLVSIEEKIELLDKFLINEVKDTSNSTTTGKYIGELLDESIPDYLLLKYCLVYPKVANNYEAINKSPKIEFYLFEKTASVKEQLNAIDLRAKAMTLYQSLTNDERKINAILLMFNENPSNFETDIDKLLRIDELYNTKPIDNMRKFVDFAEDAGWEDKYLINLSVSKGTLRTPPNSTAYYYGDVLIGLNLDEAVSYLNQNEKGKDIKHNLSQNLNKN